MSLDFSLYITYDAGRGPVLHSVYSRSITGNLVPMWEKAGCYEALYKSNGKQARDVMPVIATALADMEKHPATYKVLNPASGWGNYDDAVTFLREVRAACEDAPLATIEAP